MTDITPHEGHDKGHASAPAKLGYSPVADIPHKPRATDTDPKAARRAERQITSMFLLSMLFVVLFIVGYVTIDPTTTVYIPVLGDVGFSNVILGLTLGMSIFLIGAGAIQWAKKLMPDVEVVQERHEMASPRRATAESVANYERGKEESGFARFKMIRRTLIGAMVLFPIPLVVVLRDLWTATPAEEGKSPADLLSTTLWTAGSRIVSDGTYNPVRPEDLPVGGLVSAVPEDLEEVEEIEGNFNARTKAAIILVRMDPERDPRSAGRRLGLPGHPRLLEDLHPCGLPDRPVRAAHPPPAVPLPPVDLRPRRRRQRRLRPGRPGHAAVADRRG